MYYINKERTEIYDFDATLDYENIELFYDGLARAAKLEPGSKKWKPVAQLNIFILDEIVSYYWDYYEEPEEMHNLLFEKCLAAFEEHLWILGKKYELYNAVRTEYINGRTA
jgi:hypothetical protein